MTQASDLQYLKDRAEIQELLARYFSGLDRCNKEQVRGCFTDDVRSHYDHRPPTNGIEELMSGFRTFTRMVEGKMKVTTHFMGNLQVKFIEGDCAETETNAIAFLVEPSGEGQGLVNMRSLRYIDRLRRQQDGWRISDRVHTLDWSCQIPAGFATTLAQRVSVLPSR